MHNPANLLPLSLSPLAPCGRPTAPFDDKNNADELT